jgi:hypothetical protein
LSQPNRADSVSRRAATSKAEITSSALVHAALSALRTGLSD